jgi:hypothetical protein
MDKNAILEIAHRDPNFSKAVDEIQANLSQMNVMAEDIQQMIGMLESVLQDPSKYAEVRQAAIADGMLDENEAPEQFDPAFVASVLAALYELLDRMQSAPQGMPQGAPRQKFAQGGLAQAFQPAGLSGMPNQQYQMPPTGFGPQVQMPSGIAPAIGNNFGAMPAQQGQGQINQLGQPFGQGLPNPNAMPQQNYQPLNQTYGQSMFGNMPQQNQLQQNAGMFGPQTQQPSNFYNLQNQAQQQAAGNFGNAPQAMQQGAPQQGFARGGLAQAARQLQAAGRGGDSMLAHINPKEAEVLRRMGGSGTVNPTTGLREYKSGKGLLGAILPIALNFIVPGAGALLGGALGASATFAPILGGALISGASAALTGGDPLKGALMGGLSGGLGGMAGSAANKAFGLNLGSAGQSILGSGLVGGVAGAATGQGFLEGATQGALGQFIGGKISGMGGSGMQAGGQNFANMMAAGYDPKTAAITGGLSGLATSMQSALKGPQQAGGTGLKPSDAVVEGLKNVDKYAVSDLTPQGGVNYALTNATSGPSLPADRAFIAAPGGTFSGITAPEGALASQPGGGFNFKDAASLLPLASLMSGPPAPVQTAIQKMSPQQQEYFNRPSIKWDWNKLQQDAAMSGMDLTNYMAQNWPQIQSGAYNTPVEIKARGGPLHVMANFARGAGSGRADTIDAKLSDGEYVIDAETVALLGDGSGKEGANRLDMMRENLRAHKGKALSRGKFSPNAKSPLAYLKGAA